jgi:UDP-glucose 4-epimerase
LNQKAIVTIGDNLSSGDIENVKRVWKEHGLAFRKKTNGFTADGGHSFIHVDFQEYKDTVAAIKKTEIVFHLAANIGGRGYIATHPADCCEGFAVNQNMVKAAHEVGVDRMQFASSACVYPTDLQKSYNSKYLLKEVDAIKNNWANADETYGWAKLMGEEMLRAYFQQYGLKGAVTRYVTAFGPWENDTHAIIALIRRAVEKKDPYVIWGSGKQDRDFTYVEDIASGTMMACEKITDGSAVNIGTADRYTMIESVNLIFDILGWKPKKIIFDKSKPEGVKTRALDISFAKSLGWEPNYSFKEGLEKTIQWFVEERPRRVDTM